MVRAVQCRNAESQRTQSYCPRICSAFSATPRFKISRSEIAEHGYVLTPRQRVRPKNLPDLPIRLLTPLFASKLMVHRSTDMVFRRYGHLDEQTDVFSAAVNA